MRVALSKSGASAAVLQSLLALSSLHRHGLQSHAARLKLSALSVLGASAKAGVDTYEVISHVATLMLLCCFEVRMQNTFRLYETNSSIQIQQGSANSSQWVCYISGVQKLLGAVGLGTVENNSDMAALLYWVSYHNILAQFSLSYWRHVHPEKMRILGDLDVLIQEIGNFAFDVCWERLSEKEKFAHDF